MTTLTRQQFSDLLKAIADPTIPDADRVLALRTLATNLETYKVSVR